MGPKGQMNMRDRRTLRWLFLTIPVIAAAAVVVAACSTTAPPQPTATPTPEPLAGTVTDAYTGSAVRGATVRAGDGVAVVTGPAGEFSLPNPDHTVTLTVTADSYAPARMATRPVGNLQVALRPNRLEGRVTNAYTAEPVSGVTVTVTGQLDVNGSEEPATGAAVITSTRVITVVTDLSGHYRVENVPELAMIDVAPAGFSPFSETVGKTTRLDFAVRPSTLRILVQDPAKKAIPGAFVSVNGEVTRTGANGELNLANAPENVHLAVKAGGYRPVILTVSRAMSQTVILQPFQARGIYLTGSIAGNKERFGSLLSLVDSTELNSMVIDVKDATGFILYESQIPIVKKIQGENVLIDDLPGLLRTLHNHGVYAIARISVFEDPVLSQKRPDLAAKSIESGSPWKDYNGLGWTNPFLPEVWDYNISIAKEAASLGFDEIQFDYVRFPSDGNLKDLAYGQAADETSRRRAIQGFLHAAQQELAPDGIALSADVFGLTMWASDDMGIGQKLEDIAAEVDYVSPMVYPSHFYPGNLGFANPAEHPYEVVLQSCQEGSKMMAQAGALIRPWLQDFTLGTVYTPAMVRAQIQAANEFGTSGWLLWNAANTYSDQALEPGG